MSDTSTKNLIKLEQLIMQNIPRDVLMACEDAYFNGDLKGRTRAAIFAKGHRPTAAGHEKHLFMNEAFHEAFEVHGGQPTPLRGTRLVVGKFGIFNLARLNVPGHKWFHLHRGATRKALAELNENIQRKYVQGDLFSKGDQPTGGTVFIVGVMDGCDENGISQLTQVKIALPAPDLKSWLYLKPLTEFLALYDRVDDVAQTDNVQPKLKPKKQTGNDQGN